jgi:ribosomal peptide maturation radical SAM protein 1
VITLVLMPFCNIERPSLALGLLKAALAREGMLVDVIYANILFCQRMGIHASSLPMRFWPTSLIGEWVFASAAFPDFNPSDDRYLEECIIPFARLYSTKDPLPLIRALRGELRHLRSEAPAFIDQIARDLLAKQPKIVGCSSTFSQQTASLALLRRIRELDPEVVTIIGGANVESTMGASVLRAFPWIDVVCSGEADETIVSLCRLIMERGRAGLEDPIMKDVLSQRAIMSAASISSDVSSARVSNLNTLPFPDYDDYFAALSTLSEQDRSLIHCVLPMETSRGCWWNDKHACTFCSLNSGKQDYRAKEPDRVHAEMEALAFRYGLREFAMSDNVMPPGYLVSLFAKLESLQAPYDIFYEIRPLLLREHARRLSAAGVRHVQAGIESLHDELLVLMNKGSSVLQNVSLLKHASEFGITVGWNMLTGFPGDSDEWYSKVAEWLPLLHHLQPPTSLHGITLQRFSKYMKEPTRYGLEPVPYNSYEFIYPFPSTIIREFAYYFREASWPEFYPEMNREMNGVRSLIAAANEWKNAFWSSVPPQLTYKKVDHETLSFMDTRSCAISREITLCNLPAHIYRLADDPVDHKTLHRRLAEQGIHIFPETLGNAVEEIVAARLALNRDGVVLSLAATEETICNPRRSFPEREAAEMAFGRYLSEISRQNMPPSHEGMRGSDG